MLLKLNFSTSLLKLSLDRLGLFLGDTLFNSLGSTVNESFSVAQRKTGEVLNDLDNLKFCLTGGLQNHVESRLLGGSSLACASSGSCNGNSGSSRLNAILLLEDCASSFTSVTLRFTSSSASFFTSAIVVSLLNFV